MSVKRVATETSVELTTTELITTTMSSTTARLNETTTEEITTTELTTTQVVIDNQQLNVVFFSQFCESNQSETIWVR